MTSPSSSEFHLVERAEGCELWVRAQPGARRAGVVGTWNQRLKLALRAPPEDGRANAELLELLAAVCRLSRSQLELLRGERSRDKSVLLHAPRERIERLLRAALANFAEKRA